MDDKEYLEHYSRMKKEVVPHILEYLEEQKIPASLAVEIPGLLERAIDNCNSRLLVDSKFKFYEVTIQ